MYYNGTGNVTLVTFYGTHSGIDIRDISAWSPNATSATVISGGTPGVTYTLANTSNSTQMRTVNPFVVAAPSAYADYRPANYAVGSAVGTKTFDDFNAATRTLPRSMGALNP